MKTLGTVLALLAGIAFGSAQSNVDKLVEELSFQSTGTLLHWRYTESFTGNPAQPSFNDKGWKPLALNQSLRIDSCWIRSEVVLPNGFLGIPTTGKVRLLLTVDDYAYLWINGKSMGRMNWDGDFELTSNAKPGQRFVIAIKAINTGGPLRLVKARLKTETVDTLAQTVEGVALSLRVGQKLLSKDTYQTNARQRFDPRTDLAKHNQGEKEQLQAALQRLAGDVDIKILRSGNRAKLLEMLQQFRARLAPIRAFVQSFTLYFDANAHIDAAWLWRERETWEVCKRTFSSVLNMMNQRPDFTYTQSSAAYYRWMEEQQPELFARMAERIKEGRWEVVGGMWVEPDCNLPAGESWARQLLYGKRYLRSKFDTDVKIGWNPDSFGYNGNMPMFYTQAGITAFITQKIGWNETNVFPHRVFWWESQDGSRILSYFPFDYVNTIDDPYGLVDWLRQFEANTGFTKMLILFGVGDHGGGPSLEMIQRIENMKKIDIYPRIEYGTAAKYLNWLTSQDLVTLPVWRDELYLEYHQGTFTTQAAMKQYNREGETLLTNAEKFSAFAGLSGAPYPKAELQQAWQDFLLLQFHDILPGSSIHEVYVDATEDHTQIRETGNRELHAALRHIAGKINTTSSTQGLPLAVFNPLAWDRSDLVKVELPDDGHEAYTVADQNGNLLPNQIVQTSRYSRELIFVAPIIPSMGYALFTVRPTDAQAVQTPPAFNGAIENEAYRIRLDEHTGWLSSIFEKKTGRELLSGPGNELQILEDKPSQWDAWNIGLTGTAYPASYKGARIVEQGPVRTVLRVEHTYLKPGTKKEFPTEDYPTSFFTQDVILYHGIDRIDFRTDVDWWEEKTMLKVAFPLTVQDSIATYEIPYGTITRSTQLRNSWETAKREVPALHWADVSTPEYGVTLLNSAKYGHDIKGNVMRLSLLRSPKWPDPLADRGKHSISYALVPHKGTWRDAHSIEKGYDFNSPLVGCFTDVHAGALPTSHSFVRLSPSNLILTTVKRAEDSNAWVIQWYESEGRGTNAQLDLPAQPRSVRLSNFLEEPGAPVPFTGSRIEVPTKHSGIQTVLVEF
jgi:alpha-mannosidase